MKINYCLPIAAMFVLAATTALPAQASSRVGINVVIGNPPPPVRYEVVPAPRRGYVWAPGYWNWNGRRHVWIAGHWEHFRRGQVFYRPQWRQERDGWRLERGGWRREQREQRHEWREQRYSDAHRRDHDHERGPERDYGHDHR